MHHPRKKPERELGLAYLLVGLAAVFWAASTFLGAPQLPNSWPRLPTLTEIEILARSPDRAQLAGALALLTWAVWLAWGYVVATTALRVLVLVVERVTDGAAWARSFRAVSDLWTLPAVRRAVDASLAGVLFVRMATGAAAQEVVAAPAVAEERVVTPEADRVQVYDGRAGPEAFTLGPAAPQYADYLRLMPDHLRFAPDLQPGDVLYQVKAGDTLGMIAQRFYGRGQGDAWKLIYDANVGRLQPDGFVFTSAGQIRPGWWLVIPSPSEAGIETDAAGQRWYTVRAGDSLWSICKLVLGDPRRWTEVFALNQGARSPDGHVLLHPDLIWPGLRLRLPAEESGTPPAAEAQPAAQPEEAPAPATEAPAPEPPPPTVVPTSGSTRCWPMRRSNARASSTPPMVRR